MCFLASDLQYLSENVGIVVSCLEQQIFGFRWTIGGVDQQHGESNQQTYVLRCLNMFQAIRMGKSNRHAAAFDQQNI